MKDFINETIERALKSGKSLEVVQFELNSKNIQIDIDTLKKEF